MIDLQDIVVALGFVAGVGYGYVWRDIKAIREKKEA